MSGNRQKIVGQFIPRPVRMMESPAYRALSLSGHRVLARVEVEHGAHGGMDNGSLPVTFLDFENYGIDRHAIGPAIRECVALGFLEVTERGRSGNGDFRKPNKFRLTYLIRRGIKASNEWQKIETEEQAKALALEARKVRPVAARSLRRHGGRASLAASSDRVSPRDIESGGETPTVEGPHSSAGNPHYKTATQWGKPTPSEVVNPHWVSKSGEVAA